MQDNSKLLFCITLTFLTFIISNGERSIPVLHGFIHRYSYIYSICNAPKKYKRNVDILIVPFSDWEEMSSIAAKSAVVRGVENGCNIVRHTNRGISIVSDFRGNILSLSDYF